jgi:hypothetical protein
MIIHNPDNPSDVPAQKIGSEVEMEPEENRIWVTVKNFSVSILKTDEGVSVDIYPLGKEDEDSVACTYAFDSEVEAADESPC